MRILGYFLLAVLCSVPTAAFAADGVVRFSCTGVTVFSGEIPLVLDATSRVEGVDRTYFGFTSVQDPQGGGMTGLVMMLAGKNRSDRNMNRVCFEWVLGRTPGDMAKVVSSSADGGDKCAGRLMLNGATTRLVGNGSDGLIDCEMKLRLP